MLRLRISQNCISYTEKATRTSSFGKAQQIKMTERLRFPDQPKQVCAGKCTGLRGWRRISLTALGISCPIFNNFIFGRGCFPAIIGAGMKKVKAYQLFNHNQSFLNRKIK